MIRRKWKSDKQSQLEQRIAPGRIAAEKYRAMAAQSDLDMATNKFIVR